MKKTIKNKKILLLILTAFLLLILLSSYIKTAEIELKEIFVPEDKTKEELLFEADMKKDKITDNKKIEQKLAITENENKQEKKLKEETRKNETEKGESGIEKIALVKEIKDPFQTELKQKNGAESAAEKSSELKEQKVNSDQDLIFLERNIIAEEIIDRTQSRENEIQPSAEAAKNSSLTGTTGTNSKKEENKSSIMGQKGHNLKNIRLPFKLLGIIKNSHNSSALFLYQDQTLLKKENDKIDIFKIEKINNKNLIISYQNEERRLHLWEEKNNEN